MLEERGSTKRDVASISADTTDELDFQTKRMRVSDFFSGKKYIFLLNQNIRGYLWTRKHAEAFLENLLEARGEDGNKEFNLWGMTFHQQPTNLCFRRIPDIEDGEVRLPKTLTNKTTLYEVSSIPRIR